jgi:hypothetical protein
MRSAIFSPAARTLVARLKDLGQVAVEAGAVFDNAGDTLRALMK